MNTLNISYGQLTNAGNRAVNEDSLDYLIKDDTFGFILCDGLGGHGNGDVASRLVVETIKKELGQSKSMEESIIEAQNGMQVVRMIILMSR